jgi:hypothetical protein
MKNTTKNFTLLISFFFLTIISSCIISIVPSRKNDDGSSSLTKEDSLHLAKFDLQKFNSSQEKLPDGGRIIREIDGNNIRSVLTKNKYTWIIIWATWCPHSQRDVPRAIKFYHDHLEGKQTSLVLIAQDYNIKSTDKSLNEFKYDGQGYVLSAKKYGNDEWEKVAKMKKDICRDCPVPNVSPQHIVLGDDGKLVFHQNAELLRPDTLLKLIK